MKRLSAYTKRRFRSLSDRLSSPVDHVTPELFHEIRIEIKKLNAVLQVTNYCVKGFKGHKHFKPFRTIFRKAGEIRKEHVLQELFHDYKINPRDINKGEIPSGNYKLTSTFQDEMPRFLSSIKKAKSILDKAFKDVGKRCFKKYINLKKSELHRRLSPRVNLQRLHKTRKTIKEILYLLPIKSNKRPDPFYNQLQVLIGQWHDKQILIGLIKASRNSNGFKHLKGESLNDIREIKRLVREFYT